MRPGNILQPRQWMMDNMAHTEIIAEPHNQRVGNRNGIELLNYGEKMNNDISSLREELAQFKAKINAKMTLVHNLRLECLEARRVRRTGGQPQDRNPDIVRTRNEAAHGGNIICDIDCIRELEATSNPQVPGYREDFGVYYRIPYQQAVEKIQPDQERLVRTFDVMCSVQELLIWQKPAAEIPRSTIETNAKTIIEQFIETENPKEFSRRLDTDGDLAGIFKSMDDEFRNFNPKDEPATGRGDSSISGELVES